MARMTDVVSRAQIDGTVDERPTVARRFVAMVRLARPKQWTKNLLVFAGLVFTYNLLNPDMLNRVILSFVAFCALSSAGYVWNDLRDVAADRLHPTKRRRPIASGPVPPAVAVVMALVLGVAGLGLAFALGTPFLLVASLYMLLTASYSVWLKHLVL